MVCAVSAGGVVSVSSVDTIGQTPRPAFALDEVTVEQLQTGMQAGRYSSRQLVDLYLDRIDEIDRTGPTLRSVIETNPEARSRVLGIDAVMTRLRLDAIVAPTGSPAWPTDLLNGDHFLGASSTPAAVAGYPSITVPAGFVHGLPVGLSFIGRPWSEKTLITLAYAFEQATKHRQAPKFLTTIAMP